MKMYRVVPQTKRGNSRLRLILFLDDFGIW